MQTITTLAPKKNIVIQLLIVAFGIMLFIPGLGIVHLFDWDEINFAESAREMIITGDFLNVKINFESFWEKPPLFIWMQVLSMKFFGVNEFAARFPNAVCGIATLLVLFNIGRKLKDITFGLIWAFLYASSVLTFFYFKSGIIDPWFNLFIFLGFYYFSLFTDENYTQNKTKHVTLSAVFIGLAILTKGPVALLLLIIAFLTYLVLNKFKWNYKWKHVAIFTLTLAFVGCFWFILQLLNGNYTVIKDFVVYQIRLFSTEDAGHGGFPLYHFVVLLFGVFPASILALPVFRRGILKKEENRNLMHFFLWMFILFWVTLILFSIVRTKIIHYSSLCYFPLTFFATWYVYELLKNKCHLPKFVKALLLFTATIYGIAITAVTLFDKLKPFIAPHVKDEFAVGNMQASALWLGFEPAIGAILIATTLIFVLRINKHKNHKTLSILLGGSLFFVFTTMLLIVPQIEKYSQAAAIEFYESKKNEDCYINPTFYKSYAHYFYSNRKPENKFNDTEYLMTAKLEKTCYFVIKNTKDNIMEFTQKAPDAIKLYDKNGFAFYMRK